MLKWNRVMSLLVCLILIILIPIDVKSDSLEDMFQKWGFQASDTSPGAYEAQSRGFAVGGRMSIRAKNDMFQPITLKAPSFKAGCGGIDIFGGAFSWINAEQFTKNMRAIGQNALGYAFSLGLEWVCPTCSSVLKELQHFMNQINKMSVDSCTAAKALVNTSVSKVAGWQLQECQNQNQTNGDGVQGWLSCAAGSEEEIRKKLRDESWVNTLDASTRPKAIQGGQDSVNQALTGQSISDEDRQLILSYIGTVAMVGGKNDSEPSQCRYIPPTLSFKDLIDGGKVKLRICTDGEFGDGKTCNDYGAEEKTIEGYATKTQKYLKQIYTKVTTQTGTGRKLTTDEQTFINRINMPPVYTLIDTVATLGTDGLSSSAENMLALYSDLMAAEYAWATVEMYMQAVEGGSLNVTTICASSDREFKDTMKRVRQERNEGMQKIFSSLAARANAESFIVKLKSQLAKTAQRNMINLF
ncbi:MAG: conjugal transfer protein TraH [Smithella sp.]